MIIYLASYPRSGNSWLQRIFAHYFGIDYSNYYREEGGKNNLELIDNSVVGEVFIKRGENIRLADNSGLILSPILRKKIALEKNVYIIKTHQIPFDEYYEGEHVINIIRHPGAVVWSYFNFKRDFNQNSDSIEEIIIGDTFVGSWGDHVSRWQKFGENNPTKYTEKKYEEIELSKEFLEKLQKICRTDIKNNEEPLPGFDYWHLKSPKMFRSGQINDWADKLSVDQCLLIWLVNYETMIRNNYKFSNFENNEAEIYNLLLSHSSGLFDLIRKIMASKRNVSNSPLAQIDKADTEITYMNAVIENQNKIIAELKSKTGR